MRLTTAGIPRDLHGRVVGRVMFGSVSADLRSNCIRVLAHGECPNIGLLTGFRAVLSIDEHASLCRFPRVEKLREIDHLREGDVISIDAKSGFVRSLYRPAEKHHAMFVTERCNSNCLMCSQPPKDKDDTSELTEQNLRLIDLISPGPPYITITGGEPTLLGRSLFTLLEALKIKLPRTEVHMLTNGRTFAWPSYTQGLAAVKHHNFSVGVPLYSDFAGDHDYIVQARGAFDQTVLGLHQLARYGIRCEIRVVLHKLTIPRLSKLTEYIYRNLTFVEHIAFMGLEHTGYAPRNIQELWVDPYDYQDELQAAVQFLDLRGMRVSLYNQQLCVLRRSLWRFNRKAISDWKNEYVEECSVCDVFQQCGGFFRWNVKKRSEHIHPLTELMYATPE